MALKDILYPQNLFGPDMILVIATMSGLAYEDFMLTYYKYSY
ncbi:hypothetical protein DmGdi_29580 [Gluconobacter sp. Gdi]|nr:hypothetical protein DmGdi_29580 [Gluconobacter sp. Gdi]